MLPAQIDIVGAVSGFPDAMFTRIALVNVLVGSFLQANSASVAVVVGLFLVTAMLNVGAPVAVFVGGVVKNRLMTERCFQEDTVEYQWLTAYMVQKCLLTDPLQTYRTPSVAQGPLSKSFFWSGSWVKVTGWTVYNDTFAYCGERSGQYKYMFQVIVYSLRTSPISKLLEEGKDIFSRKSHQEQVIIYSVGQKNFNFAETKLVRVQKQVPLMDAIALSVDSLTVLVDEAAHFWESESWYNEVGMPFRKGYILHGPPGSGQRDAVFAIAGKLGRAVYTQSLKPGVFPMLNDPYTPMNNAFLVNLISEIPKGSIFLLEDLDECFARPDFTMPGVRAGDMCFKPCCSPQQATTFGPTTSGIIEMLDSIARPEGILFFATMETIGGLDDALLQPGRIDKTVEFGYVNQDRAHSLFRQVFPDSTTVIAPQRYNAFLDDVKCAPYTDLATQFANQIPADEFALAEVRNYLIAQCGKAVGPAAVVAGVPRWVEAQRAVQMRAKEKAAWMREEVIWRKGMRNMNHTSRR